MINITLYRKVGSFAENKDFAREIRTKEIIPALEKNKQVVLDFKNIDSATQSFVHALISDLMRRYGNEVLDKICFKDCNKTVQKVISLVVDYMQERE